MPRDDYDDRPRNDRLTESEVRDLVKGPARWLAISGWFSLLCSLVFLAMPYVVFPLLIDFMKEQEAKANGVQKQQLKLQVDNLEVQANIAKYTNPLSCALAFALSVVMIVGAGKMKRLSHYGWSMAGCICGIIPMTGCCIITLPFGIWGLTVVTKSDVKAVFKNQTRRDDQYDAGFDS